MKEALPQPFFFFSWRLPGLDPPDSMSACALRNEREANYSSVAQLPRLLLLLFVFAE